MLVVDECTSDVCKVYNEYGKLTKEGLIMFNSPDNFEMPYLSYKYNEIEYVVLCDPETVEVHCIGGEINNHKRRSVVGNDLTVLQTLDYTKKDLWTVEMEMRRLMDLDGNCMTDLLTGYPKVNRRIYGGPDEWVLLGKESHIAAEIAEILSNELHVVKRKKEEFTVRLDPDISGIVTILKKVCSRHLRNPFVETVRVIHWDGEERIKNFLYKIGCTMPSLTTAEQFRYLHMVLEAFLLSVIERNFEMTYPSIQFVMVIIGKQGSGKSTICERLGLGERNWYRATSVSTQDPKKFDETVEGGVIAELKESNQFHKDGAAHIKASIDSTSHQYRRSYAAFAATYVVRYSMIATTNDETILDDQSGNRRFFPFVKLRADSENNYLNIAEDITDEEILQLYAEALELYNKGQRWNSRLEEEGMAEIIRKAQSYTTQDAPETDDIRDFVDVLYPNIGDRFTSLDFEKYLYERLLRNKEEVLSAKQMLGRHLSVYGFESRGQVRVKVENPYNKEWVVRQPKVYERVRLPTVIVPDEKVLGQNTIA